MAVPGLDAACKVAITEGGAHYPHNKVIVLCKQLWMLAAETL